MDQQMQIVIEAEGLTKEYPAAQGGALTVLDGVALRVARGEAVAVMGPSGSGKSTLLHILGALDSPTSGSVRVAGRDPFALKEAQLAEFRNQSVGFVFQDHVLLPQCTALENVLVPTLTGHGDRRAAAARAVQLLETVGLRDKMDSRPAELSGGERQRVAIARALVNGAKVMLCDEPTGNLDAATGERIGELFEALQKNEGVALVVVTHNEAFARHCNRVLHLRNGKLE